MAKSMPWPKGPIAVAGYAAQGINASIVEGVPTVARIENGAIVEREIPFAFESLDTIRLALRTPDFTTAQRIEEAINAYLGANAARAIDPTTVEIQADRRIDRTQLMAHIENLRVSPDTVARVVIDARSGTIVIGANVRIGEVAVSQGGLTVLVREEIEVSQPEPFSIGETVIVPQTEVEVRETEAEFTVIGGNVSLQRLVDGLNAIGVGATETISILAGDQGRGRAPRRSGDHLMTEVTPAIAQAAVIAARPAASAEVETAREFEAMFSVSDRGSDAQDGPRRHAWRRPRRRDVAQFPRERAIADEIAGGGRVGVAQSVEAAIAGYGRATGEGE
jgi:hypothetical protein